MRALHDNDALSDSELADFERTAGVRKPTQDVLEADAAYAETAFETFAKQPTSPATLDSPVWVHIERKRLLLGLADGRWVSCPIDWFPRLERGDSASLGSPQLSPLGIHWPGVDEDISVDGLFAGRGDLTIGSGQRARFIDAPTPRIERVGHGIDTAHLQLSDGRCLGIPLDAITHTRRAPDSDHPLRPSPTEKT
ncbi:DUF2442 domain-containing protein [Vreelandella rituensis]|uniref:DUF2442 domain-containing protein n=2 Tax=Vreelandella rituensis TaxID=2282306 RepID=A0A368UA92_9GAMM|nr:DUF2442 domain-containing protein [Halomonas rituensis]